MEVTELVLGDTRLRAARRSLMACGLFERDPALLKVPYYVKSRVSVEVFSAFVDAVQGSEVALTAANVSHMSLLCEEFEFGSLSGRILSFQRSTSEPSGSAEAFRRIRTLEERLTAQERATEAIQAELAAFMRAAADISVLKQQCDVVTSSLQRVSAQSDASRARLTSDIETLRDRCTEEQLQLNGQFVQQLISCWESTNVLVQQTSAQFDVKLQRLRAEIPAQKPARRCPIARPLCHTPRETRLIVLGDKTARRAVVEECPSGRVMAVDGRDVKVHISATETETDGGSLITVTPAEAVIFCYDVGIPETVAQVRSRWLSLARASGIRGVFALFGAKRNGMVDRMETQAVARELMEAEGMIHTEFSIDAADTINAALVVVLHEVIQRNPR
jgi:hypothetical protein